MISMQEAGRKFAESDCEEQAKFLNAAGYHLSILCGDRASFDTQICNIENKLNPDGKYLVNTLSEYVKA